MMRYTLFTAALLVLGGCSANDRNQGIAIASGGAPAAASGTGAPPVPGTSAAGVGSVTGGAGAGPASGVAGQTPTGMAGRPSAGAAGATAGASGSAAASGSVASGSAAGAGGLGAAGMAPSVAGSSAAGSGGASGTGAMGGTGAPAPTGNTPGTVTLTFRTVSYDGEYAPGNYGAVWFENASGKFVKTAKRWAGTAHASDLVAWTMASGGWGSIFGGGNTADMMDAMSSATIRSHQMHMVTWNMKGADGQLVPDGAYVTKLEMSESRARDRAGPLLSIEFTKGSMPQTVEVPDREGFSGVVLRYMP